MTHTCDVLVVGGGPAGMAAAAAAASAGKRVVLLDDNRGPGGQIWRAAVAATSRNEGRAKRRLLARLSRSGAVPFYARRVVDAPGLQALHALNEDTQTLERFAFQSLVVATGARERFLPFPGWTLPGIFGAGGLQALVKGGFPVAGKRIVVAGTGPLLLAIAAHLQQDGAEIVTIAEQAPLHRLARFAGRLLRHPSKLAQGARHRFSLRQTRYRTGCWPVRAEGDDRVSAVQLTDGRHTWTEPCDLVACGFHLVPNTELARLLGCALQDDSVQVNRLQQTTVPRVFCAGEPTGIAGVDAAVVEGTIAGLVAAERGREAERLVRRRNREHAFGVALNYAFALRPELRHLARPDTIVCRCEDVPYAELEQQPSWTDAKLQTRCGMGPCQGRICGPAVQTLFGWSHSSVRPPIFPVPLSAFLSGQADQTDTNFAPDSTTLQETR